MKSDYKNIMRILLFVLILGTSINVYALSCNGVFDPEFLQAMRDYVYIPIKWATPILLIFLTSFDFAKVVFNGKKEDMDKAKNNFLKRLIAAVIIFFAPDVLILIADIVGNGDIRSCLPSFK